MPAVHRLYDICTGHDCYPSRPNVSASDNVFANGFGAHRVGDGWQPHCCGSNCHSSSQATGSPTVFVNGLAWGRVGDNVACGSINATGSPSVFADDS